MMAGQYGVTPAQVQYLQRTAPGEYMRMVSGSQMQFINQLPGMTPAMISDLQQMIQQAGGGAAVKANSQLASQIADQFLNKYQPDTPGMDMNVWASILSAVSGEQLDQNQVMPWVVQQVAGNNLAANAPGGAGQGGGGAAVSAGAAARGQTGGAPAGRMGLAQPTQGTAATGRGAALGVGGKQGQTWQQVLQGGPAGGAAAQAYLGQEQKTGKRSPVLEALLQNAPAGTMVAVRTSSGTVVMPLDQAIKNYPDEIEAGQADFYNSKGSIIDTSSLTGGITDPGAAGGATKEAAGKAVGTGVQSLSQWQKQHPTSTTGGGRPGAVTTGGVTVDLTNEAKQLLKLLPSNTDNAAAASTVPQNPYYTSPSR
jgi:hypothetical protein